MKDLLVLAALCAIGYLVATVLKSPAGRIHWSVTACLVTQFLFIAGAKWAVLITGPEAADNESYKRFYGLIAVPLITALVVVSSRYSMEHGRFYGIFAFVVCALFAGSLCFLLRHYVLAAFHLNALTPTIRNHFILASVLLAAGCATLLSLAAPSGDIEAMVKVGLGLLWTLDGAYRFAYCLAMLNPHLRTVARFDWVPIALALVMAVGLAHKLNSSQRELSRQALPDLQVMELVTEEPQYETE